jgi:general secretion pathway protein B
MSFILEALKKADKKQQDGTIPKLETVHMLGLSGREKRSKWVWLLLFLLLLNAGVLLWLFGPWQLQDPLMPILVSPPSAPLEGPVASVKQPQPAAVVIVPVPEPPTVQTPVVTPSADPVFEVVPEKIYLLSELPPAVRKDLPAMHMSLHAFNPDSTAASLVRINDQIMRVGGRLANRYLLEEITADGAILRYDNYRILVPRKLAHAE